MRAIQHNNPLASIFMERDEEAETSHKVSSGIATYRNVEAARIFAN
ncbi:hypothetical protein [Bradyrhizobium iriomotense]|nr:hypothetical protein [Bradyrhizobium iriomotense]